MLSLFKRKVPPHTDFTFKQRVERFWAWYAQVAPRFYSVIESKNSLSLAGEVSSNVDKLIPGFAWVFGPGENNVGHSFTLSGEGDPHRQLLSIYWLSRTPKLSGWTFYASRQPSSIRGQRMEIGEQKFDPLEFWITPTINREEEKLDIAVWHRLFEQMDERERWTVLFLFLDEVLGEYGTQHWIGEIKMNPARLGESIPLEELRDFTQRVQSETGWEKFAPGEGGVIYRIDEQHSRFLRGDIVFGRTTHLRLVNDYSDAEGEMEDPLAGTGADFVFVAFDNRILPPGGEVDARAKIEDALDNGLKESKSGRLLGGALGTSNAYIDLLLFDGAASIEIVRRVLRDQGLPAGTSINFFAKEKRGHRILL
jgi:hypothetical protein